MYHIKNSPVILIADKDKKIYDVPLAASGMKGRSFFQLKKKDLIKMPKDSELFLLPERSPIGYDAGLRQFTRLDKNPLKPRDEECSCVAAFLAPGYTATFSPAYVEKKSTNILPLFSYSAVAYYKDNFYSAGFLVDREKRQKLEGMDTRLIKKNVSSYRKIFPDNRLVRHLETCALLYSCPAAKNFFLSRYECPLPTSSSCNAVCAGCISLQAKGDISVTQPRIKFVPTSFEIAQIALFHMEKVKDSIVSFGQGCEGEPLMASSAIEGAIRLIREKTSSGIINLNTNASKPDHLERLFRAGLDSIRVSMNSARADFYGAYYNPRGYSFKDVLRSIKIAKSLGKFVSINYLVMPGFTDSRAEQEALWSLVEKMQINMIQWRNLNYDPVDYFKKMKVYYLPEDLIGMDNLIRDTHKKFSFLMRGYFNPSKNRIKRFSAGLT
ncbi:radical SAM domain-containing protein [Candidatus Omnitrophus magneticus]|uniref:Radical SAM domain-containing protein n=1 Tax=Candidatus Omnitrophus magneticus TaxID=1609969 RepID=A0A0F0CRT0_9BACT|nr:radical SAM domain-containing protein [Candidatus Omnitrophus magneticus]